MELNPTAFSGLLHYGPNYIIGESLLDHAQNGTGGLSLVVTASSLDNQGFLTVRIMNSLNRTRQTQIEVSIELDYLSRVEIAFWKRRSSRSMSKAMPSFEITRDGFSVPTTVTYPSLGCQDFKFFNQSNNRYFLSRSTVVSASTELASGVGNLGMPTYVRTSISGGVDIAEWSTLQSDVTIPVESVLPLPKAAEPIERLLVLGIKVEPKLQTSSDEIDSRIELRPNDSGIYVWIGTSGVPPVFEIMANTLKLFIGKSRYIAISHLFAQLDNGLWKFVYGRNLVHDQVSNDTVWSSHLVLETVPKPETIHYCVLADASFGLQVIHWFDIIETNMGEQVADKRINGTLLSFFCAVILIDAVSKKAESFLLASDVRSCFVMFPKTYVK